MCLLDNHIPRGESPIIYEIAWPPISVIPTSRLTRVRRLGFSNNLRHRCVVEAHRKETHKQGTETGRKSERPRDRAREIERDQETEIYRETYIPRDQEIYIPRDQEREIERDIEIPSEDGREGGRREKREGGERETTQRTEKSPSRPGRQTGQADAGQARPGSTQTR